MKRSAWLVVFVTGCSTAPCADFMDHFLPAKINPQAVPGARTRGGVCDPQSLEPKIGAGPNVNTPSNPAVAPGPIGGPPMLPTPGGGMSDGLPQPSPPTPPPAFRF